LKELMRICVDLDGVICELRKQGESYGELKPIPGAAEKLRSLRQAGHYIIIATARHMQTCGGNVGQVIARQGQITLEWLSRYAMEYDEIHFGKPHAHVYIDDNAFTFRSWDQIADDGSTLPSSREELLKHHRQEDGLKNE
jgi:capsule biosynthesis phosphatase